MIRLAVAGAALLAPALATAEPRLRDPDWPCQQIKVAELSLPAVWSGPAVDPQDTTWKTNPSVADLVEKLAPRRLPMDQAQVMIRDFARQAGERRQTELLQLLVGLFAALGQERDSAMAGLDRFGRRQKELAAEIRADNGKLRDMQAAPDADPKAVQQLTQQVTWEVEVFQDRRQAIGYACDVPGKIEQRLFTLAHQIQQELE